VVPTSSDVYADVATDAAWPQDDVQSGRMALGGTNEAAAKRRDLRDPAELPRIRPIVTI
jgi:hypothetical protein